MQSKVERRVPLPEEIDRAIALFRAGHAEEAKKVVWQQTERIRKQIIRRWLLSAKGAGLTWEDLDDSCWPTIWREFQRFASPDGGPACSWAGVIERNLNRDLERILAHARGTSHLVWQEARRRGEASSWADCRAVELDEYHSSSIAWEDELVEKAHRHQLHTALEALAQAAGVSQKDLERLLSGELDKRMKACLLGRFRRLDLAMSLSDLLTGTVTLNPAMEPLLDDGPEMTSRAERPVSSVLVETEPGTEVEDEPELVQEQLFAAAA